MASGAESNELPEIHTLPASYQSAGMLVYLFTVFSQIDDNLHQGGGFTFLTLLSAPHSTKSGIY